jgi:hypothetical protein
MKDEIVPGDLVVPHQFIDRTKGRPSTFFGGGIVGHVAFADPVCHALADVVAKGAATTGARVHQGGTYICMEGPQFSTRAESNLYRTWDVDVIGMTNIPEAKLAREAELCYSTVALATDYDCWHDTEEDVDRLGGPQYGRKGRVQLRGSPEVRHRHRPVGDRGRSEKEIGTHNWEICEVKAGAIRLRVKLRRTRYPGETSIRD